MNAYVICGSRLGYNFDLFDQEMDKIPKDSIIISGGANGVDEQVKLYCIGNNIEHIEFMADWKQNGRAAGPIRNQKMAEKLKELKQCGYNICVICFPGGRGTDNMRSIAEKFGFEVKVI